MDLNLPILHLLDDAENILIAGAGGGFDVFAGLPLFYTLRQRGKNVHLANYSFSPLDVGVFMTDGIIIEADILVGARGDVRHAFNYFPEGFLAQWFKQEQDEDLTVWMLPNMGVAPVRKGYAQLIDHLNIDALILVDGGVDSIMRGDESGPGTLIEDSISLAAVKPLDIPVKILACIGFGTEVEERVCHYHALENMAGLAEMGAFWGSCALTAQMEAFQYYEKACRYVWEQPDHRKSHISTRIIPAVHGAFGHHSMYQGHTIPTRLMISPLMSLYWFFDANAVIELNLLMDLLEKTESTHDAFLAFRRLDIERRHHENLPY